MVVLGGTRLLKQMPETPSCCEEDPLILLRAILLEFLALATNPPSNLQPGPFDSMTDLYRKILLTLPYI